MALSKRQAFSHTCLVDFDGIAMTYVVNVILSLRLAKFGTVDLLYSGIIHTSIVAWESDVPTRTLIKQEYRVAKAKRPC